MVATRSYKWGAVLFGIVAAVGLVLLPHAVSCCSRFSPQDIALRETLGWSAPGPLITAALMDWPLGFRLLLLTIVAALVCAAAMLSMMMIARSEQRQDATVGALRRAFALRALISSLVVGVLYLLATYAAGYVGASRGLHNLVWLAGIPVVVAWIGKPSWVGLALGVPLAITGFACLILISVTLQIPLD
jgi:hypothetical protein